MKARKPFQEFQPVRYILHHSVFVYVPQPHPWTWSGSGLFQDHDSYSLKLVDKNIIRVHVRFEKGDHVKWEVKPDEFLKMIEFL